jgi:hypothetical protein
LAAICERLFSIREDKTKSATHKTFKDDFSGFELFFSQAICKMLGNLLLLCGSARGFP